jgi:hypothetical protein
MLSAKDIVFMNRVVLVLRVRLAVFAGKWFRPLPYSTAESTDSSTRFHQNPSRKSVRYMSNLMKLNEKRLDIVCDYFFTHKRDIWFVDQLIERSERERIALYDDDNVETLLGIWFQYIPNPLSGAGAEEMALVDHNIWEMRVLLAKEGLMNPEKSLISSIYDALVAVNGRNTYSLAVSDALMSSIHEMDVIFDILHSTGPYHWTIEEVSHNTYIYIRILNCFMLFCILHASCFASSCPTRPCSSTCR